MTHLAKIMLYLIAIMSITMVHNPVLLLGGVCGVFFMARPNPVAMLWRSARRVFWIATLLSFGYGVMGLLTQQLDWMFLLLLNSRLLLLSFLTTWLMQVVCWRQALMRWPEAQRWLVVVRTQAGLLTQLSHHYRDAVRSRSAYPGSLRKRYCANAAMSLALLDKSVHNAEALTLGMRSRGVFND